MILPFGALHQLARKFGQAFFFFTLENFKGNFDAANVERVSFAGDLSNPLRTARKASIKRRAPSNANEVTSRLSEERVDEGIQPLHNGCDSTSLQSWISP
jgi:hypothetical protein